MIVFAFAKMSLQAKHIVVHGAVQGVGFRYFVRGIGRRLRLTGDVRNLRDSTVDIVVEGDAAQIEEFIRAVRKGPSLACVDRLDIEDMPAPGRYRSFLIEGR